VVLGIMVIDGSGGGRFMVVKLVWTLVVTLQLDPAGG